MCDLERARRLRRSRRFPRRRRSESSGRWWASWSTAGCRLRPDRRAELHRLRRPADARAHARRAARTRCSNLERAVAADNAVIGGVGGRAVFGLHICRGNRASMWHREGSYDADRRGALRRPALRPAAARVRHRARRRLRAAALRAQGRDRRARPDHHKDWAGSRPCDELAEADRRRDPLHSARAARAQPAVRLRLGHRRQPADRRRAMA